MKKSGPPTRKSGKRGHFFAERSSTRTNNSSGSAASLKNASHKDNAVRPAFDTKPKPKKAPEGERGGKKDFSRSSSKPAGHQRTPQQARPAGLKLALYGQHAVTAAWLNPKRNIHTLYFTPAQQELAGILRKQAREAGLQRPEPVMIEPARLDASFPTGTAHQGIALGSSPLNQPTLEDLLGSLDPDEPATLVMLDQVTDPHNIGAILRSVAAFGGAAIILQSRHAPEPNAVMGKTACGALDIVPICYEVNLSRSLELLAEYGFVSMGFDERGDKLISAIAAEKHPRKVLVMGAEGEGLRRLVRDHCTYLVSLPTTPAMPSLNVSNATAVALYALTA